MFRRVLSDYWELLLLFLWPFVLLGFGAQWMVNKTDIDVWFYYGYFQHFLDFWSTYTPTEAHTYYGTRLPFILPGYLTYYIFGDTLGRYVFKLVIVYPAIVFSFWYIARLHTSRLGGFLAAFIFATDIFFVRSVGSDYVDLGVVVYQILTFAILTCSIDSDKPRVLLVWAGFTAACMVFVHLLSAVFLPVFLAYYVYLRAKPSFKERLIPEFTQFILNTGIGAAICIVVCGLIFVAYSNGPLLFFLPQIKILLFDSTTNYNLPLEFLVTKGYWLVMPFAVISASTAVIVWTRFGGRPLSRSVFFWLSIGPAICIVLAVFRLDGLWFLASRDGLYATFFLPITYLALGILLFGSGKLNAASIALISVFFAASIILRVSFADIELFDNLGTFPAVAIAVFVGLLSFP